MHTVQTHVEDALAGLESVRADSDTVLRALHARGLEDADIVVLHEHKTLQDIVLATSTLLGDVSAVRTFDQALRRASEVAAGRTGMEVSEIAQRLRERLLVGGSDRAPQLAQYDGRGSVDAWLRVCAFREALIMERSSRQTEALAPEAASAIEPFFDPELRFLEADTNGLVKGSFRAAFADLPAGDKVLLAYHYLDGHTMRTIANVQNVDPSTVQRRLRKVREKLLAGTRRHFEAAASLEPADLDLAIGQLRSRLDLSISRLLREHRDDVTR